MLNPGKKCQYCGGKVSLSVINLLACYLVGILTLVTVIIAGCIFYAVYRKVMSYTPIPENIIGVLLLPFMLFVTVVFNLVLLPKVFDIINIKIFKKILIHISVL